MGKSSVLVNGEMHPAARDIPVPRQSEPGRVHVHYGAGPAVEVIGRVDRAMVSQVRAAIRGLCMAGVVHLVIDVSAVTDCDTGLLSVLATARARLLDTTGTLTITGIDLPRLLPALHATTVAGAFVVYQAVRRDPQSS